jgi:imidazole glycerol phosphate synthase subunit HisF
VNDVRRIRVIPTLLMSRSRNGLVKGTRFRDHVYIGDPINAVKVFNDKGVDEIAILDIDATREKRGPDLGWLEEVCGEAFMPLAYGGGIASVEQAKQVLRRGAEKIILNASALRSVDFVREAAKVLGSQSIVVSIDVKRTLLGGQRVFGACGTTDARIDPTDFAVQVAAAGAGEILLTSKERSAATTSSFCAGSRAQCASRSSRAAERARSSTSWPRCVTAARPRSPLVACSSSWVDVGASCSIILRPTNFNASFVALDACLRAIS